MSFCFCFCFQKEKVVRKCIFKCKMGQLLSFFVSIYQKINIDNRTIGRFRRNKTTTNLGVVHKWCHAISNKRQGRVNINFVLNCWLLITVFLNRCAATHKFAVEFFKVCHQNLIILKKICKKSYFRHFVLFFTLRNTVKLFSKFLCRKL
jgi:hypothetical protein